MTQEQAISLFERLGEAVRGKTAQQIRGSRNRLLQKHHPDYGGSTQVTKEIIEAFALIQNGIPDFTPKPAPSSSPVPPYRYRRAQEDDAAAAKKQMAEKRRAEEEYAEEMQRQRNADTYLCDTCVYCHPADEEPLIHCGSRRDTIFRMKVCHRYTSA